MVQQNLEGDLRVVIQQKSTTWQLQAEQVKKNHVHRDIIHMWGLIRLVKRISSPLYTETIKNVPWPFMRATTLI